MQSSAIDKAKSSETNMCRSSVAAVKLTIERFFVMVWEIHSACLRDCGYWLVSVKELIQ